jgi:hypothetical protein
MDGPSNGHLAMIMAITIISRRGIFVVPRSGLLIACTLQRRPHEQLHDWSRRRGRLLQCRPRGEVCPTCAGGHPRGSYHSCVHIYGPPAWARIPGRGLWDVDFFVATWRYTVASIKNTDADTVVAAAAAVPAAAATAALYAVVAAAEGDGK